MLSLDDYQNLPFIEPDYTYAYGDADKQFGQLYLPAAADAPPDEALPVVVVVHGGCWRAAYGAEMVSGLSRALADEGCAVWNLEYQCSGSGGGWPQTFLDVAHGLDYLRHLAEHHRLDLTRVVLVGHSAGGTLVCWAAARYKLPADSAIYTPDPLPVRHVVCLAGIVNLAHAEEIRACADDLPLTLGGTSEQVPDHYQQASPMALLPLGVPQTHIVGEYEEKLLPHVQTYIEAAQAAGDAVDLHIVPNSGHYEVVVPQSVAWPAVRDAVRGAVRAAG